MSARWRAGECWIVILWRWWMDERRIGGRVLEWDTVALLDGRQLEERKPVVLDGRESAGVGYGGVAGRETAG